MGTINKVCCWIATLGPIGYLPAPGTWGTLCAVPCMYALRMFFTLPFVLAIVIASAGISFFIVHCALPHCGGHGDPSQIVIDEFIGFAVLACSIPLNPILFVSGFLLFRFFDIVKPFGIKTIERYDGALGIMLDDLLAAVYAALCVWGIFYIRSLL